MKYGKERKFVLHFKEADPGKQRRRQSVSYKELKEFSKYVGGANERKGSIYEKIEIYWPHKLLEVRLSNLKIILSRTANLVRTLRESKVTQY